MNLRNCHYEIFKEVVAADFKNWAVTTGDFYSDEWDLFWQDEPIESEKLHRMKPYQKVNHFPAMFLIARKTFLAKNLNKMRKLFPEDYDFFPKTWIIPNEINDL